MRARQLAGTIVIALACALLLVPDAGAHTRWWSCPGQEMAHHDARVPIRARATRCRTAERVVARRRRRALSGHASPCVWRDGSLRPGRCTVLGWRGSAYHTTNGSTYPVVWRPLRAPRDRRIRFIVAL